MSTTVNTTPFILVQDDDDHWYLIPDARKADWHALGGDIDNADPLDWIMPVDKPSDVKILTYVIETPADLLEEDSYSSTSTPPVA